MELCGSGDSEDVLADESFEQELRDAVEVLAWLADQPWCSGRMMGISWGGFNALQVAVRRPPSLGAIVTVCSTDDRYADVHYMGGCLLSDNLSWASTVFAYTSCPPDPAAVAELARHVAGAPAQERAVARGSGPPTSGGTSTGRTGSVGEDYDAIQCPVLAVSGWADGYSNSVFRILGRLSAPRMALIGPWSHKYPPRPAGPGHRLPAGELRWWDHWLKDVDKRRDRCSFDGAATTHRTPAAFNARARPEPGRAGLVVTATGPGRFWIQDRMCL